MRRAGSLVGSIRTAAPRLLVAVSARVFNPSAQRTAARALLSGGPQVHRSMHTHTEVENRK